MVHHIPGQAFSQRLPVDIFAEAPIIITIVRFFIWEFDMAEKILSKGETTRARILDTAYELFLKQGYAATSIREIAEASSLTLGGIYAHFSGKEAIWAEVFDARHPYHEIIPVMLDAQGETMEEILRDTARRMLSELDKREDIFNLMFIEIVEFNGRHFPRLADRIIPSLLDLARKFLASKGQLRSISPVSFARAFGGLFLSYYITKRLMPPAVRTMVSEEKALDEFIDIFLFGVLSDQDPARREHA
jgi:AcrR family transcriptional regulator